MRTTFLSHIVAEKLAVYDQELAPSLLGAVSLITTLSQNFVPNNDVPTKYKQKRIFGGKKRFCMFPVRETGKGIAGIFVERVELYHNPKVHEKPIMI
jgi:hypothetical protein